MSKKQEVELEEKVLTNEEMRMIEHSFIKTTLATKDLDLVRVKIAKAKTEITLFSAQHTLKSKELVELTNDLKRIDKELQELKKDHSVIKDEIARSKGLEKDWGFDPETGVIK